MRGLRAKGLFALVSAVLALGLAFTSTASASEFKAGGYPASLTGSQLAKERIQIFFGTVGEVICETATLSGTLAGAANNFTAHPVFGTCESLGSKSATLTTTGCDFKFTSGALAGIAIWEGDFENVCGAGSKLTLTAGTCELEITSFKSAAGKIDLVDDLGAPEDVTIYMHVPSMPYNVTKDGLNCPLPNVGKFNDGSIFGRYTVTATTGGKSTWFKVE